MIPVVGQLGMWYYYSPDTRFASFAFWWLGAGLICFPLKEYFPKRFLSPLSAVLLLFSFSLHTIDAFGQDKELFVINPSEFVPATSGASIYTTNSGMEIWVPNNGGKCDDNPLPCTQNFDPNLSLINDKNIASGFFKIH